MHIIEVEITGDRGILFENPQTMTTTNIGKKKVPTPEEEAALSVYWNSGKGSLAYPSWYVYRCFLNGSKGYKIGRWPVMPLLCGSVEFAPEMLEFGTAKYLIDTRRVVLKGGIGILRSRGMLPAGWKLSFQIKCLEDLPSELIPKLREILETAGRKIGLGGFRIEKKGPFGKFSVTRWEGNGQV